MTTARRPWQLTLTAAAFAGMAAAFLVGLSEGFVKRGEFYPDGTLLTNVEANLSTEPDGLIVTWETLESRRVRLIPRVGAEGDDGPEMWLRAVVAAIDGSDLVRRSTVGDPADAENLGEVLAQDLLTEGAATLMQEHAS